jgi:ubiquinone/menaquinone biosynthesis C-methylase UbiE
MTIPPVRPSTNRSERIAGWLPAGPDRTRRSGARTALRLGLLALGIWPEAGAPAGAAADGSAAATPARAPAYGYRQEHDPNGLGKFYLGREIAHVMGHQGADWLERPERIAEEKPDLVVPALRLKPGETVADIGAGTGYFSWRLATAVGPKGTVLAVDIQQEMLDLLATNMTQRGITNVRPVLGAVADPKLPVAAVDLVLMVDVYHEFSEPYEMLHAICAALRPGGRVAFVEYRAEDPSVPIKQVHKMTEVQVRREAELHALEWVETIRTLPRQHLILFRKRR